MPTRTCFGFWLLDFCGVVSVLFVLSVEALEVVPAVALVAVEKLDAEGVLIPILERHEVKKIPAAEEASNNIKFFLFILTISLNK